MSRRVLWLSLLSSVGLVACDGGPTGPMIMGDAGCGSPGVPADQPQIACPAEVDLGCLGDEGAPIAFSVASSTCSGETPTVTCTPEMGATVRPGTTSGTCTARSASGAMASCSFPIRYRLAETPTLSCAAPLSVACSAPLSDVDVPEATPQPACAAGGPTIGTVTSDAPATGFPVGETTVSFEAPLSTGGSVECSTTVTVTDDEAPTITCPMASTLVRRSPDEPPGGAGSATATDTCDADVEITVAPMGGSETMFLATATDDAGLTAMCTFTATVLDVFAAERFRVLSAELAADGSTDVTLTWEPSTGADVDGYRLERAPAADGPFAMIAMLAPDAVSYTDMAMPSPRAFYRLVSLAGTVEGGITPAVRALAIAADGYEIASQPVSTVPFATTLYGVVRAPADTSVGGPFPFVLFLHGNHGNCRPATGDDDCATITEHDCTRAGFTTTPNAEGYVYLMESLAAQGYVAVSISANALNCRDDFIRERAQLILAHLSRWQRWSTTDEAPFAGRYRSVVDMTRVGLVGHSRGGEAVALAPAALRAAPIAGVTLRSVLAIAPTDYHDAEPTGVPFAVLLPSCDADVSTLEGLEQYDRGLDASDPNARMQVLYVGANHNFFNTEWRFDDNGGRGVCTAAEQVGAPAQRAMLEGVLADWLAGSVGEERFPAYLRGESADGSPISLDAWADRDLDLRWSYAAASRLSVDTFDGAGAPMQNALGEANTFTGYTAEVTCSGTCAGNFPHLVTGIRLAWQDATASASWGVGTLDASAYDVVSLRFASRLATINDAVTAHDFTVRVRDAAGTTAAVRLSAFGRLPHRYTSRQPREILSTVRVPLDALRDASPTLDVTRLSGIELEMPITGGNTQGSIWVADVDVAGD